MNDANEPDSEGRQQFLEGEPPPLVARGLAIFLLSLFVVTAVLAALIRLPETVTASFVLVPMRGADPIRAPRSGHVTEVRALESARVTKGKVLFVLLSPGEADRNAELVTAEARERGAREGLANAQRKEQAETLSAEEEMKRLLERTEFLQRIISLKAEQLRLTEEQAARARLLHEQGLTSADEQDDSRIRRAGVASDLEQLQTDLRENRTAIEKLRYASAARRVSFLEEERTLLEQANEARIQIDAVRGEVSGSAPGQVEIEAPCDGTILRLGVRGEGAVVRDGETLAEIGCVGERLQAELTVPQGGLSRLRPGQNVKLLYEAFPYQRFGVKVGIVRWASPSGTTIGGAPVFRAFAELDDQTIRVDGEDRPLSPGMMGNARIVVGRRSVISYVFAPLRQLREAIR